MRAGIWTTVGILVLGGVGRTASDWPGDRAERPDVVASLDAMAIPAGTEPIKIDGDLTEEIWTKAPASHELSCSAIRSEGAAATHATEVAGRLRRDGDLHRGARASIRSRSRSSAC